MVPFHSHLEFLAVGINLAPYFVTGSKDTEVKRVLEDHQVQLFHFTDKETEVCPVDGICPKSRSQLVGKPEVEPALLTSSKVFSLSQAAS